MTNEEDKGIFSDYALKLLRKAYRKESEAVALYIHLLETSEWSSIDVVDHLYKDELSTHETNLLELKLAIEFLEQHLQETTHASDSEKSSERT